MARTMVFERLDRFQACGWEVASFGHAGVAEVHEAAGSHADAARIATCQRVEVYAFEACGCAAPIRWEREDAVGHLAEVAAGLHAAVLGESQVLGQVRSALAAAPADVQAVGAVALAAAREFRRQEGLTADTGDLLDRALDLAGRPAGGRLLVLGGGQLGHAIARRATALGFEVDVALRHRPGAEPRFNYVALREVGALGPVDVVVGCLGSHGSHIDLPELPRADLLIDLGTPRNFPEAGPGVITVAAILEKAREQESGRRDDLAGRLRSVLDRRIEMARHTVESPVGRLRGEVEAVRRREAARIRRQHPEIPQETVDAVTRALVNKLFHAPSLRLKDEADPDFANRVADLFAAAVADAALPGEPE